MGWFWADEASSASRSSITPPHPISRNDAAPPPGCPMHNKTSTPAPAPTLAARASTSPTSTAPDASACPYQPPSSNTSQPSTPSSFLSKINPLNLMPSLPNTAAPSQTTSLDLEREVSTIPRGDNPASTWEYPSPQQMYNAMLRKGYTDTPAEDVPAMVAVHNFLNEGAWGEILGWEARFARGLREGWEVCRRGEENAESTLGMLARQRRMVAREEEEAQQPSLVRFLGRPDEPTPKARIMQLLGWAWPSRYASEPPFDRHDWYVRRHWGPAQEQSKEVRYVIDYYSGPTEANGMPCFYLDVRPAVDSPTAAAERLMRWGGDVWWRASGASVREEESARRMLGQKA